MLLGNLLRQYFQRRPPGRYPDVRGIPTSGVSRRQGYPDVRASRPEGYPGVRDTPKQQSIVGDTMGAADNFFKKADQVLKKKGGLDYAIDSDKTCA